MFLSDDESERLVAAASKPRDRIILLCALFLGVRVSELVGLLVERIDFPRRQVLIFQGKGGVDRMLPIAARLEGPLREWVGGRTEGWLFPSPRKPDRPLTTRAVQMLVEKYAAKAGIRRPDGQRVSPHKLRHTFCTRLLERGANLREAQELMGHASLATTQVYAHCTVDRLRGAVDRL